MAPKKRGVQERFWEKVEKTDSCWIWKGGLMGGGYGKWENSNAHRFAYKTLVGDIPEGLQLDHLCRNRQCVNPKHLEPVTAKVNTLRGESPSAKQARQTHCKRGHEFTEENTYWTTPTAKNCRACKKIHNDRNNAKRKVR